MVFLQGGGVFSPTHKVMPKRDSDRDIFSALSFRNFLNEEMIRDLAMMYYTPPEIKIVVLRECDSVMYPPVGFYSI